MPARKVKPASDFGVAQIKIFDGIHEEVEKQFNELCAENELKIEDVEIRHCERRQGEGGNRYTYLVVIYQIKNPVG